jgi:histidyl-tRNA synthetase
MDRILLAIEKEGEVKRIKKKLDCYIVTMDKETDEVGFLLLNKLRKKGIPSEKDFLNRSIKAQMKAADRLGAKYSIIIGTEELSRNEVTLRRMSDSSQKRIRLSIDEIIMELNNNIK